MAAPGAHPLALRGEHEQQAAVVVVGGKDIGDGFAGRSPSALTETRLPSERTPHSSEVSIGSVTPSPLVSALSSPSPGRSSRGRAPPHRPADHVLVGEAGQLEAAFAGVDHAFLLVADEEGGVRRRIIIVE